MKNELKNFLANEMTNKNNTPTFNNIDENIGNSGNLVFSSYSWTRYIIELKGKIIVLYKLIMHNIMRSTKDKLLSGIIPFICIKNGKQMKREYIRNSIHLLAAMISNLSQVLRVLQLS